MPSSKIRADVSSFDPHILQRFNLFQLSTWEYYSATKIRFLLELCFIISIEVSGDHFQLKANSHDAICSNNL